MKVQYCSDLHLEFRENHQYLQANPLKPVGDILLLAGDIFPFQKENRPHPLLVALCKQYKKVFMLPGNHEYYGGSDVRAHLTPMQEQLLPNLWLVNNTSVVHRDVVFIFTTLWSRISMRNGYYISQQMNDFRQIRYQGKQLTVGAYNQLFNHSYSFLDQAIDRYRGQEMVVVTHHLPSGLCNAEEFRGSTLNEAFCVELHDFVYASGVKYWVYGHSHRNVPPVQINDTTLLTNQLGYVAYGEAASFKSDAVITF